jgi:hypothetical protein
MSSKPIEDEVSNIQAWKVQIDQYKRLKEQEVDRLKKEAEESFVKQTLLPASSVLTL